MQDAKSQPLMLPPKPVDDVVFREIIINDADPGTRYRLTKRGVQEEVFRNSRLLCVSLVTLPIPPYVCICLQESSVPPCSPEFVLQTCLYFPQIQHKSGAVITTRYNSIREVGKHPGLVPGDLCQQNWCHDCTKKARGNIQNKK